jgi:hypothetical protein
VREKELDMYGRDLNPRQPLYRHASWRVSAHHRTHSERRESASGWEHMCVKWLVGLELYNGLQLTRERGGGEGGRRRQDGIKRGER